MSCSNPLTTLLIADEEEVDDFVSISSSTRTPDRYAVVSVASPQQGEPTPEPAVATITSTTDEDSMVKNLLGDFESEPYRRVIFVVIPVFMAYACLFALQGKLKTEMNVECGASSEEAFGRAVSALYIGNLIFRFAHNLVRVSLKYSLYLTHTHTHTHTHRFYFH